MSKADEKRAQRLITTREAAAALVEDLRHIREIVNRADPDRGELRRLSGVLRRLFVDGDLNDISGPRTGRLMVTAPDNKPFYDAEGDKPYAFFGSGGVTMFGISFRAHMVESGTRPRQITDFDPDRTISLPIHNFMSQNVLCLQGQWIMRRDVIKYTANIAGGVHSGAPREEIQKTVARIRRSANYRAPTADTPLILSFNMDAMHPTETPFQYDPTAIDPLLVEILATAHFLVSSPSVESLETAIREELKTLLR
jgi:hypothetical protein